MTSDEITALVERELAAFHYEPPAPSSGLLGTPWSAERVARGVEALRSALVSPYRVSLAVPRSVAQPRAGMDVREAWVVALVDEFLVFYDPSAAEFGLAEATGSADATDICVRGDLVGTFFAA
jgi:hypothetical protein